MTLLWQVIFKQALQNLHEIIASICSNPENTKFRNIPKDNSFFHRDIGQYDGGYEALIAMGFNEIISEIEQNTEANGMRQQKSTFVLVEPDLSSNFDAWNAWFEDLKEMRDFIANKMQERYDQT